jgi:hypothetical protein
MGDVAKRVADLLNAAVMRVPWQGPFERGEITTSDVSHDDLIGGLAETDRAFGEALMLVAREIDALRDEISHRS